MTTAHSQSATITHPLRVLELITPSRIGGAETHVATITQGLAALGDDVRVFCPEGRPLVAYLRERGITPITWKTWGKVDPRTLWRFMRLIQRERIDVVHAHLTTAALLGSFAARLTGRPCVATVHGFTSATCYRHATRIIAVSGAVKEFLVAQGIPAERIRVVHNGIPLARYPHIPLEDAKRARGFDPTTVRVGIFGRLSPEKGHEVALDAWPEITERFLGARLMLVGAGPAEEELRLRVKRLGMCDTVDFTGFVSDPRTLMAACDLILVPSRKEGFGLAAIEAMALGRPVVASDTGGLPEIVIHNTTGLLSPPGDREALTAAMSRLLDAPQLAQQMGAAGRARVESHFDASRQLRLLHQVLAEVTG